MAAMNAFSVLHCDDAVTSFCDPSLMFAIAWSCAFLPTGTLWSPVMVMLCTVGGVDGSPGTPGGGGVGVSGPPFPGVGAGGTPGPGTGDGEPGGGGGVPPVSGLVPESVEGP